jgi:hypothetical protein
MEHKDEQERSTTHSANPPFNPSFLLGVSDKSPYLLIYPLQQAVIFPTENDSLPFFLQHQHLTSKKTYFLMREQSLSFFDNRVSRLEEREVR